MHCASTQKLTTKFTITAPLHQLSAAGTLEPLSHVTHVFDHTSVPTCYCPPILSNTQHPASMLACAHTVLLTLLTGHPPSHSVGGASRLGGELGGVPSRGHGGGALGAGRRRGCCSPWLLGGHVLGRRRPTHLHALGVACRGATTHAAHLDPTLMGVACDRQRGHVLLHLLGCGLVRLAQALDQHDVGAQQHLCGCVCVCFGVGCR